MPVRLVFQSIKSFFKKQYTGSQPATAASIDNASNWESISGSSPCPGGTLLCAISFDDTQYTTLQAALDRAKIDFPANNPTQGQTINGITYYLQD
jgi:hypothetical protein